MASTILYHRFTVLHGVWAPEQGLTSVYPDIVGSAGACPHATEPLYPLPHLTTVSSPSAPTPTSNFQSIFYAAVKAYEKKTKNDLLAHPLAAQLQACKSPTDILAVLQEKVKEFDQSRSADERLSQWLNPTINVLYSFSASLGAGVTLVFSPATVIFSGIGVLLQAAKDVEASQDALIDLFERIENFFKRLESHTAVSPTDAMTDIIVKIMVEVLNIFAIATKEIRQGRAKKYLKKLIGKKEMEDALKRLDKLTQEEARMATAEILRLGKETKQVVQQIASSVDDMKWYQVRESLRTWVTPPDPSTNHTIACGSQHDGSAQWFFRGGIFSDWKSTASLLWIYGKPGSGKSILCSAIIQDIQTSCKAGLGSIAYFYFDFRDLEKQSCRNLLPSLLVQLSTQSSPRCDILHRLYLEHGKGAEKPTEAALTQCLKDMLTIPDQRPVYVILDALDECPNSYGIPSPRSQVLTLVKQLMDLHLSHLHICVTSRPEFDIWAILGRLALHSVSLHDESGQMKDIVNYVKSVVYSDSEETMMKRWREEDKKMVVETLSEKADGMFRWVFCQLETLQQCLPQSLRRTLNELPESLDGTYERVMMEIKRANQSHAYRMLQCLTVANRPLYVAELAELLAFDFDDAKGGIPKLNSNWRWEDHEQAVLSTCSSLVTVVPNNGFPVVQFSHFSVKEFLMSDRLATSRRDISQYHISLLDAHKLLAQASLAVLLRDPDVDGHADSAVLAGYAAEHWMTHARVEDIASQLRDGMKDLFDPEKPHFEAWVQLYDIDAQLLGFLNMPDPEPGARPLYYAALCGFLELVEQLALKYPEYASARGGVCGTALHSASFEGHLQVVRYLLRHGVDVNVRDTGKDTPFLLASWQGHCDVVQCLLEHGADVELQDQSGHTPLNLAAGYGHVDAVRLLLELNADVNSQDNDGWTPLHNLTWGEGFNPDRPQIARLLLKHGANANARNHKLRTPLHLVSQIPDLLDILRLLLEHGADLDAKDEDGKTPLQLSLDSGHHEVVRLLSGYSSKPMSGSMTSV